MSISCKAVLCLLAIAVVVAVIVGLLVGARHHSSSAASVDPASLVSWQTAFCLHYI